MKEDLPVNVKDFGAAGDGKTDDTAAIQKAMDRCAGERSSVVVPPGIYLCSTVKLPPYVGLQGYPSWGYREMGGSVIRLADEKAACLLDMTGAIGATVNGMCFMGDNLGEGVHGIWINKDDYGKEEDAWRIERCRIAHFSGDGIRLDRIWCFSIRNCMVSHNGGNGLRIRGWDGFILDNWFSGNRLAGIGAYEENCSTTITGNRIEWNREGGVVLRGGSHYNVTGNYIDRSGGPGIDFRRGDGRPVETVSVTGNVIYRSGKPEWTEAGSIESSHILLDGVAGASVVGNSLRVGRDDGGKGSWSPVNAIVCRGLEDTVVKDNVMYNGSLGELVLDLGGHGGNVIIGDNVGRLFVPG